jgi:hypothetical protein
VQAPLDGLDNCVIQLWDHHLVDDGADYDWRTNTGGHADATLLFEGPAQYQVYRYTLVTDGPIGSVDQIRTVRFTIKKSLINPAVKARKGQRIVITECANDDSVTSFRYVVASALNSGSAFRRTIEAEVDMAQVV